MFLLVLFKWHKIIKKMRSKLLTLLLQCGMIYTTKGNSDKELARSSELIGFQPIGFPRFKVHPFAETILHQKGGRDPMASEESQLHMLSASRVSPVMQNK